MKRRRCKSAMTGRDPIELPPIATEFVSSSPSVKAFVISTRVPLPSFRKKRFLHMLPPNVHVPPLASARSRSPSLSRLMQPVHERR